MTLSKEDILRRMDDDRERVSSEQGSLFSLHQANVCTE